MFALSSAGVAAGRGTVQERGRRGVSHDPTAVHSGAQQEWREQGRGSNTSLVRQRGLLMCCVRTCKPLPSAEEQLSLPPTRQVCKAVLHIPTHTMYFGAATGRAAAWHA